MYLFSVIIPAYNAIDSIEKCISSIPDCVEIIVIDDGSTDGTKECVDELCNCFPNLAVIHQTNSGVSAARNKGLEVASGKYICFVDSDDTIDTKKMTDCLKLIESNSDIDMLVYGISFDFYRKNDCYRSMQLLPPYEGIKTKDECLEVIDELFDANCLSSLCTRIVKKSLFDGIKLREDMFLYEDLECSLRILARCETICLVRDAVYHYRQISGHTRSRILRITDIHEITDKIEEAFSELNCNQIYIVLKLKKSLEFQRIQVLTFSQLRKKYPDSANILFIKRIYVKLRHTVAEYLKYQLWRVKKIKEKKSLI